MFEKIIYFTPIIKFHKSLTVGIFLICLDISKVKMNTNEEALFPTGIPVVEVTSEF